MALLGIGMAGIWAPLAATATRNLPMQLAGAGSGVYNATRQVGAVLGSAAIAVLIDSPARRPRAVRRRRARGRAPAAARRSSATRSARRCPTRCCCRPPSCVLGFVSVLFFELPRHLAARREPQAEPAEAPAPALD